MRSRRVWTIAALAPILIAMLLAASVAACERHPGPPTSSVNRASGGRPLAS
jgi:hypothetical protein